MMPRLNIRRNVTTGVIAFAINIALTFVGYRLLVLQGGTAALGLWSALSAAIYIIRMGDVGMGSSAERYIAAMDAAQNPALVRGYLDTALVLNGALFLILALIGWGFLSWQVELIVPGNAAAQAEALDILPIMLMGFVALNVANVITSALRGLHLAYISATLSVAAGVVQMAVTLTLVPRIGVVGLAWAQLAHALFTGAVAWFLSNRELARQSGQRQSWLPFSGSCKILAELFSFSIRAQAVNLVNGLFEPASKLLVGHAAGLSVLGLFEMAWKMVSLPRNAVVSGIHGMTPAMTRLYASEREEARRLYNSAKKMVFKATAGVLTLVMIGSPIASWFLLGAIDKNLVIFTAIMAAGFLGNVLGAPAYTLGYAAARLSGNMISTFMSLLILALSFLVLMPLLPLWAGAIAASLGLVAGGVTVKLINERLIYRDGPQ